MTSSGEHRDNEFTAGDGNCCFTGERIHKALKSRFITGGGFIFLGNWDRSSLPSLYEAFN